MNLAPLAVLNMICWYFGRGLLFGGHLVWRCTLHNHSYCFKSFWCRCSSCRSMLVPPSPESSTDMTGCSVACSIRSSLSRSSQECSPPAPGSGVPPSSSYRPIFATDRRMPTAPEEVWRRRWWSATGKTRRSRCGCTATRSWLSVPNSASLHGRL